MLNIYYQLSNKLKKTLMLNIHYQLSTIYQLSTFIHTNLYIYKFTEITTS
jgi:hypothetical protein